MNLQQFLIIKQASRIDAVAKYTRLAHNRLLRSQLPEEMDRIINGNIRRFGLKSRPQVVKGKLQKAIKDGVRRGYVDANRLARYGVDNAYGAFMPAAESVGMEGIKTYPDAYGMQPFVGFKRVNGVPTLGAVEVSLPSVFENFLRLRR